MEQLVRKISKIIGVIFFIVLIQKILAFFGFELSTYLLFLLWFIVVAIFYVFLPKNYTLFLE